MAPGARERFISAIAPGPSPGQVENLTGARGSVSKRGTPPVVFFTSAPRDCPPRNVCTADCAGIGAAGRACGLLRRGRAARPFAPVSHPVAAESTSRTSRLALGGRTAFERARRARAHRSAPFGAGWVLLGRVFPRARVRAAGQRRSTRRPRANRTICLRAREYSVQGRRRGGSCKPRGAFRGYARVFWGGVPRCAYVWCAAVQLCYCVSVPVVL